MSKFIRLFILICMSSPLLVQAGPFGLEKGMSLEDVRRLGNFIPDRDAYWYRSSTIRNGHDNFEGYSVLIVPGFGLCKVLGVGKDINSNAFGDQVRSTFQDLSAALAQKYGPPSSQYDFVKAGSIWKDPNDFMMGLVKEERVLSAYWVGKGVSLPDKLQAISISARATASTKGYVNISYEFDNANACLDRSKARNNSNL